VRSHLRAIYLIYLDEGVSVMMRRPAEVLLATAQAAGGSGKPVIIIYYYLFITLEGSYKMQT